MLRTRTNEAAGSSTGSFVDAARASGLTKRVARVLEPAARELFPEQPGQALTSRAAFERAAMLAVIGDAGNLELSFSLVDSLAGAVEALGLARASDVPDPFRRVWIANQGGARKRGVVLRCEAGEVAVFCPPNQDRFTEAGDIMRLSYRGFASSVEYELRLNDAVRLPGALVLHLNRPTGAGAIGRHELRLDVHLAGQVRLPGDSRPGPSETAPCEVLDVSAGGLRIACQLPLEQGQEVELEVALPDGDEEPLCLTALVRWARGADPEDRTQGLRFSGMSRSAAERYEHYLRALLPAGFDAQSTVATAAVARGPALPAPPRAADSPELEHGTHQAQEVERLRRELLEHQSEAARLDARVKELEASLDGAAQRSAFQAASLEELMAALEEARARGATVSHALSLFPTVKRMLDDLEGTLSTEELL